MRKVMMHKIAFTVAAIALGSAAVSGDALARGGGGGGGGGVDLAAVVAIWVADLVAAIWAPDLAADPPCLSPMAALAAATSAAVDLVAGIWAPVSAASTSLAPATSVMATAAAVSAATTDFSVTAISGCLGLAEITAIAGPMVTIDPGIPITAGKEIET